MLEVVAVSGQALYLDEASRTAGHDSLPMAAILRMCNERLVRMIGPEDQPMVDTYHDRVRETIQGQLDESTRRAIHRSLAEVIEVKAGGCADELRARFENWESGAEQQPTVIPRVFDLAYHFDAAGEADKAWIYALQAGEQARRQAALEVRLQTISRLAEHRNADECNKAVCYRIAEGYGGTLLLLGRYEQAVKVLGAAIEIPDEPERKARIELLHGEVLYKEGLMRPSIAIYESGLRRLGVRVPGSRFGLAYGLVRECGIQAAHSLMPFLLHRQAPSKQRELIIRLLRGLCYPYIFRHTPLLMWGQLSEMNRAERLPASMDLGMSYAIHACLASMMGWSKRGALYGDRSMTLARQFDDLLAQGSSNNYQGIGHYASARYESGLAHLKDAIEAFQKAGEQFEIHLAHFHKGCCHFGLGNLTDALAEARWTFASSARVGDTRTLCSSYLWARATGGDIPFEELKSCFPSRPDDVMSTVHGIMAEGHWHTFHGRTEEAVNAFERAGHLVRNSSCVNAHTILSLPNLAGALR